MLGPHLTEENLVEVLARAKHRTKKEIARLVRELDPLPDVLPRIEPLGPAPARLVPEAPTWSKFVQSTCPVRELTPGDRPRDWVGREVKGENVAENDFADGDDQLNRASLRDSERRAGSSEAMAPVSAPVRLTPQRYIVQFTASEEYVKLVEEARALPIRSRARLSTRFIFARCARSSLGSSEQKYALTERPRKRASEGPSMAEGSRRAAEQTDCSGQTEESSRTDTQTEGHPPRIRTHQDGAAVRLINSNCIT